MPAVTVARFVQPQFAATVEKDGGQYFNVTQMGPGAKRHRAPISELKAAEICALDGVQIHECLREAKASRFPYQAILAELMDL